MDKLKNQQWQHMYEKKKHAMDYKPALLKQASNKQE